MKFSKSLLASAIALTLTQSAIANWTTSAVIKNETAMFSKSGTLTGSYSADSVNAGNGMVTQGTATSHSSGDTLKSETSARIFMNGEFDNGNTAHIELRPVYDSEAANSDYEAHQAYTQQDFLREAYVDTTTADGTYLRIGKQQIVWGKADGAKFMDLINPTDYREMAQNAMDESRITVWGLNAEKILDDGSTLQVTLTQPKENVFAGLNRNISTDVRGNNDVSMVDETINNGTDEGHAFILLGPDSITGRQNGFLNIVPDVGSVAGRFSMAFEAVAPGAPTLGNMNNLAMTYFTVDAFESMDMTTMAAQMGGGLPANFQNSVDQTWQGMLQQFGWNGVDAAGAGTYATAVTALNNTFGTAFAAAEDGMGMSGQQMLAWGFQPLYNTTLSNVTNAQDSAFDYFGGASFFTFDAFVNAKSQYVYDMPEDYDVDLGAKWSKSLDSGANLSFAYSYNYDKNPIINLGWKDVNGNKLYATRASFADENNSSAAGPFNPALYDGDEYMYPDANGSHIILSDTEGSLGSLYNTAAAIAGGASYTYDAVDFAGNTYGGAAQVAGAGDEYAILEFEQKVERVHNLAAAFDYAVDTDSLGAVVLRGEFVYTKDGYQPVIHRTPGANTGEMDIGNLVEGLKMEKADRFKYVLGADVTVLTDMMVSAQFIQDRNLDYVDTASAYTTAYASMHLSNGFIKDIENKEFYSLFLSKPFGESGEGRWNNILMVEEGGGRWNRFDVEYSLSNEVVGTFEVNKYWGDENSQFGQLENSSNVQVGLKYIIE